MWRYTFKGKLKHLVFRVLLERGDTAPTKKQREQADFVFDTGIAALFKNYKVSVEDEKAIEEIIKEEVASW